MRAESGQSSNSPLGTCGFLISEVSSLGVVCYVADKLWDKTHFSPVTWGLALLVWTTISIGASFGFKAGQGGCDGPGFRRLLLLLSVGLCALVVKEFADPFSWRQAGAFGALLLATLIVNRAFLGLIRRRCRADGWEGFRFGAAQGVALYAVHPYIRSALMGAGDAGSYSLMVADFLEQRRSGIFPVFVEQSWFGFNGGFHLIRTAPYLQHLAWIIDTISLGTLNSFAILNLAVLASMLGATVGCYAALRIFMVNTPWASLGLATLYGLCPGVLAPLYGRDMYPTFMTLPFLPWLVLGIAESAVSPNRLWPWAMESAALAAIWFAHPPVAGWATLIAAASGCWTIIQGRRAKIFGRMVFALALFIALSGYLFVSVYSLGLPPIARSAALTTVAGKMSVLRDDWVGSFAPLGLGGGRLSSDLQLGYGLWVCVALAAAGAIREKPGRVVLGCFALILIFTWPIPFLTESAWRALPTQLLLVNLWPDQRLYVPFAALAVFVAAAMFRSFSLRGRWRKWGLSGVLLSSCFWSASEARNFFERAAGMVHTERDSESMHRHQGIVLSRTHSYEYLGIPGYFSFGHMDPRLETRLLDIQSGRAFADGSTYRPDLAVVPPQPQTLVLRTRRNNLFDESLHMDPGAGYILRFDFFGQKPVGELQITEGNVTNLYTLPQSGLPKAFGSGPGNGNSLILENSSEAPENVSFVFVAKEPGSSGGVFAHVSVEPLATEMRAVRLVSLTPFHAFVSANHACHLETPKLFIPGYEAVVDGAEIRCARSSEGLLEVPLAQGEHEVTIVYSGTRWLRLSYFGSALAWIFLSGAIGFYAFASGGAGAPRHSKAGALRARFGALLPRRRLPRFVRALFWISMAALFAGLGLKLGLPHAGPYGSVRMAVVLPPPVAGRSEPLVTTGHQGAGDFVYIRYIDGSHVLVGHDKWGFGGAVSAPIGVDYDKIQTIEVSMGSLYPDTAGDDKAGSASKGSHAPGRRLSIKWNGATVLSEDVLAHPSKPGEVTIGKNTIGGSTTASRFSGDIVNVSRIKP